MNRGEMKKLEENEHKITNININKFVSEFLLESAIPKIRGAIDKNDSDAIVKAVILKADRDTMSGGRFNTEYSNNHENYRDMLFEIIALNRVNLSSSVLISGMMDRVHKDVKIGLVQKLVNMTLKYFYVIDSFGYGDKLDLKIKLEYIDCPLDSTILDRLSNDCNGKNYTRWTQLNSMDEYDSIQNDILNKSVYLGLKYRLCYDLKYWGLPIEKN